LYTLDISEDEFHLLKTEQSLLVDFQTFPSKLVELLRQCQAAAAEEHPRFVAVLTTGGAQAIGASPGAIGASPGGAAGGPAGGHGRGHNGFAAASSHSGSIGLLSPSSGGQNPNAAPTLTVTETNPFRQLCHLSLRFVGGNDAAVKTYLAEKLSDFKAELASTREDLSLRTRQLSETAEHAATQAERLRTGDDEHAREIAAMVARHSNLAAEARESAVSTQQGLSRQAEAERIRLIERHEAEASGCRAAQQAAEQSAARLTARLHETELGLRERSNRLEGVEQEVTLLRRQTAELRSENAGLSSANHSLEKAAGASRVELAALGASVADKENLAARTSSLLEASADAKRSLEESLAAHKENNARLQSKLKVSAAEILKGNQIIGKLQADVRSLRAKLKLRAAALLQATEATANRQRELDEAGRAAAELRAAVAIASNERAKAEEASAEHRRALGEAQELLRSNQQVIQWLNKELNDTQAGTRAHSAAALLAAAKGSAFRPSLPRAAAVERPASMAACDNPAAAQAPAGGLRTELRSKAALAALGAAVGAPPNADDPPAARAGTGFSEYLAPSIAT